MFLAFRWWVVNQLNGLMGMHARVAADETLFLFQNLDSLEEGTAERGWRKTVWVLALAVVYSAIDQSARAAFSTGNSPWAAVKMQEYWREHVAGTVLAQRIWYSRLMLDRQTRGESLHLVRKRFAAARRVHLKVAKLSEMVQQHTILGVEARHEFFQGRVVHDDYFHAEETLSAPLTFLPSDDDA